MQILSEKVSDPIAVKLDSDGGTEMITHSSASRIHSPLSINTPVNKLKPL